MHQLFEPHTSTENDVVLVNGNRETFLVRNGFKWPVRFLGESSNTRLMMIFSPESRLGMSRVKPIQNAIFNEVMTIWTCPVSTDGLKVLDLLGIFNQIDLTVAVH